MCACSLSLSNCPAGCLSLELSQDACLSQILRLCHSSALTFSAQTPVSHLDCLIPGGTGRESAIYRHTLEGERDGGGGLSSADEGTEPWGWSCLRIMGCSSGSGALFCTAYRVKELRLGVWMKSTYCSKKSMSKTCCSFLPFASVFFLVCCPHLVFTCSLP